MLVQLSVLTSACHILLRFRVSTLSYGHLQIALQIASQVKLFRVTFCTLRAFNYLFVSGNRSKRAVWLLSKEVDFESTAEWRWPRVPRLVTLAILSLVFAKHIIELFPAIITLLKSLLVSEFTSMSLQKLVKHVVFVVLILGSSALRLSLRKEIASAL